MDGRERILTALAGDEPDRIPCALGFYHQHMNGRTPNGRSWEDLVDVQFVRFDPSPEEEKLRRLARPYDPDTRLGTPAQIGGYIRWQYWPEDIPRRNPLAKARSLDDLRSFPFPDVSKPLPSKGLARQVRALHRRGQAAGGNLPHLGGELFEAAWRLRGLENFLLDLVERPDWAHFLLDRLTDLARRNAVVLASAGVDVLALDDDVGMPGTMMMSPGTWRLFFKPRLRAIIDAARDVSPALRVLFHSDGYFAPIIDDLIEIGVDAVNPLQPDHMDAAAVRRRYGPALALWGTIGHQTTFSFSTPAGIRDEVERRIETLGRAGLILCPAYDIDEPDIPRENVSAFLDAVAELG